MMKSATLLPLAAALMMSTAAIAQDSPAMTTTPPAATEPTPPATTPAPAEAPAAQPAPAPAEVVAPTASDSTSASPVLTDEQAKALRNKVVWSSDDKNVGEVADVVRDGDGRVKELHADIGGFLGFGETRVRVAADEFRMINDRIVLTRTEQQVSNLPQVIEN